MKKMTLSFVSLLCLAVLMSFALPAKKKKKVAAPENYVYVPSGNLLETIEGNEKKEARKTQMKGYFMSSTEVSHLDYKEFLVDLEKNDKAGLEIAKIQTKRWNDVGDGNNEPFVQTYSSHLAYENYPVVNVSKAAAELYCKWLTQKWNAQAEKPKGMENMELEFRLPMKDEWVYAAKGGHDLAPFPWGGYYIRNAKGCALANYKVVDETKIKFNRETGEYEILDRGNQMGMVGNLNDGAHITAPVTSYHPNDYGLYNMSGNVSEMLAESGTKGGSWGSTAYYLMIDAEDEFPNLNGAASPFIGFRPVAIIKSK